MTFKNLNLAPALSRHLDEIGFIKPTSIQEKAIPIVLRGLDLVAAAATGSGKTASFLLPLLHVFSSTSPKARLPRALILEPTRELAQQVHQNLIVFGKYLNVRSALLVGGEPISFQEKALQKLPDIIVATPGRVLDFLERQNLLLHGIKAVVIDEADRMLDMGFLEDVNLILEKTPSTRQTLLFSATFQDQILELTKRYMLMPKMITIENKKDTPSTIKQYSCHVSTTNKRKAVRYILKEFSIQAEKTFPSIIFCNRKNDVNILTGSLLKHGFKAASLHGDLLQRVRNETLEKFHSGDIQVLVASDVAARGLDVDNLAVVINFDMPHSADDYVHRIGRTGRAGKSGYSFSFTSDKNKKLIKKIETLLHAEIESFKFPDDVFKPEKKIETPTKLNASALKEKSYFKDDAFEDDTVNIKGFGKEIPAFFARTDFLQRLTS